MRYDAAMRTALTGVCCFTIAASCWIAIMSIVLGRPGYEIQVALAVLFVVLSLLTLGMLAGFLAGAWARVLVTLGAAGVITAGGRAIALNLSRPHFEGYAVVIGTALVVQGLLTLWSLYVRPPSGPNSAAPIW
jgi:hypothetical protein